MNECYKPVSLFDGLFINEEVIDTQRRDRFTACQRDLHFAAMAVKREWPRITPNFHAVQCLIDKKIQNYLCTVSQLAERFSLGLRLCAASLDRFVHSLHGWVVLISGAYQARLPTGFVR